MQRNIDIKNYIDTLFACEDEILQQIQQDAKAERLPNIQVSPNVGKLLYFLTKLKTPERVLEIGSLAGYSAIWIARALSSTSKMISLEVNEVHAALAKRNIERAHLDQTIEIRTGNAADLMDRMIREKELPFDLIFIDADKDNYPVYLEKSLRLVRNGTLIISDNLIPKEEIIGNPSVDDREAQGIYQFNQMIASHPNLESILIPKIVRRGRVDALGLSLVHGME